MGPRRGAAWGRVWAQHGAVKGRSAGLRRGATACGCAGAQQRAAAQWRSVGPRMGTVWASVGAQHEAAQGRSMGLRWSAAWGCARSQHEVV